MRMLKWLVLVVVIVQVPFACSLYRTRQLAGFIGAAPESRETSAPFADVRGAVHAHSLQGGHSTGFYTEMIEAAKQTGCSFLWVAEHPREPRVLTEIQDPDLIVIYGSEREIEGGLRVIEDETGSTRFLTHFEGKAIPPGFDGIEIYNIHENAQRSDTWFQRLNFLYHQLYRPELFFFHLWEIDAEGLSRWDVAQALRQVAGIAGNDAHQNIGLTLETASGQRIFSLMVDPYLYSFQFVSTRATLPAETLITRQNVLKALESGSSYVAFDRIGDPRGFSFHARDGHAVHPMGSRVGTGSELVFQAPIPARFVLKRGGRPYRELEGVRFSLEDAEAGVYRVEVYPLDPPFLLKDKPWILSNPIFVE